jgi:hypothetical protein
VAAHAKLMITCEGQLTHLSYFGLIEMLIVVGRIPINKISPFRMIFFYYGDTYLFNACMVKTSPARAYSSLGATEIADRDQCPGKVGWACIPKQGQEILWWLLRKTSNTRGMTPN